MYEVDTINWQELAKRYNETHKSNISFRGSKAWISNYNQNAMIVEIKFYVSNADYKGENLSSCMIQMENSNRFTLRKDASGQFQSTWERTSIPRPPNPQSIQINTYKLYNIVPDYLQPYHEQNLQTGATM